MKMLLGSALTLALVIPSGPANAELLKNLKMSGGVDLQATSARNVNDFSTNRNPNGIPNAGQSTGNDRLGTMMTRTWAGLGWDLLDDVHAKITLRKNDRAWGTVGGGGQQNTADAASQRAFGNAGSGALDNLFVNEANIKIDKLMGSFDTTLGRQFWGESGDLIAAWGPKNTFGLFVTAIDAVSVQMSNDWVNFMGIAGRTVGNPIGSISNKVAVPNVAVAITNDRDVRGIDVAWKMLPVKINTFVWNAVTHGNAALGQPSGGGATASGLNDNLWLYGAKLKGEAAGGWVMATLAANGGQNRTFAGGNGRIANSANYIGKGFLFDAGYKLDVADIGGFTPWVNWGWGSGRHDDSSNHNENFTTIASDYRPGVMYGRFSAGQSALALGGAYGAALPDASAGATGVATAGLTNRIIWGGGLKFNCARHQKSTLGLSYWDFNYQKATNAAANFTTATGNQPSAVGNRHIGSEIDVQLDWAHSENVMLSGGWASFQPGGFIKESVRQASGGSGVGVNPSTMLFGDISVKF